MILIMTSKKDCQRRVQVMDGIQARAASILGHANKWVRPQRDIIGLT